MKFYFFYLYSVIFLLISCDSIVKKPEKLLTPEQMEKVLYDIAILNATKNIDNHNIGEHYIDVKSIIYEQNGIDSIQLVENITFYSSKPKEYQEILKKIELRLQKEDSILSLSLKDSTKIPEKELLNIEKLDIEVIDSLENLKLNP
ncbi:MAG: DUF4296 domain-containing protein [Capnocytophaga sp.]|nr:DUF4296 domain-containing protein [Capnocytophaga sp.]